MKRLKKSRRRAGIAFLQRETIAEEEQKRLKKVEEIRDVLPFSMGKEMGLKTGNVCINKASQIQVGRFCLLWVYTQLIVENACQWGTQWLWDAKWWEADTRRWI